VISRPVYAEPRRFKTKRFTYRASSLDTASKAVGEQSLAENSNSYNGSIDTPRRNRASLRRPYKTWGERPTRQSNRSGGNLRSMEQSQALQSVSIRNVTYWTKFLQTISRLYRIDTKAVQNWYILTITHSYDHLAQQQLAKKAATFLAGESDPFAPRDRSLTQVMDDQDFPMKASVGRRSFDTMKRSLGDCWDSLCPDSCGKTTTISKPCLLPTE
jgi:hypothetical protein